MFLFFFFLSFQSNSCMSNQTVYLFKSHLIFPISSQMFWNFRSRVYTCANAMKILPCFDARIHMYNRSCNDAEKILRRPRGDSVDVHVSLTRSMPRMTVDDFFFFFFSLFPFLLYHSRERSRSPCEVKITRRLMGLNIWKGENTIIHEGEKILHDIKRVDEIMMADKDT